LASIFQPKATRGLGRGALQYLGQQQDRALLWWQVLQGGGECQADALF
jgi:hypothetical protein